MSLAVVPLALFLAHATFQDVRCRAVYGAVFAFWGCVAAAGWAVGLWPGALLGYLVTRLGGLARGDRYGAALAGALVGLHPLALALALAFASAFVWWRRWGDERSPADFAFFPFLSAGVGGMVGYYVLKSVLTSLGVG